MSGDDLRGVVGAVALLALAIVSGWWWFIFIASIVAAVCALAFVPAHFGGASEHPLEPSAPDDVAERLRGIHRSLDGE